MIVEPALRQTARALHQMRNHLLKQDLCTVYSPCLHEGACPALDHPDDWCHEERPWQTPPAIAAIDRDVGFIKDALKFSYLLLRTDGRTIVTRSPQTFRVVSELRELKGEKRAWLCNETGRPEVGRLDRKASPQNAAVDSWHRGAIVQIERIVRKEREGKVSPVGRIESDAAVEIVRPRLNISNQDGGSMRPLAPAPPAAPLPRRSEQMEAARRPPARGTRALGRMEGAARCPSCSQNAHDQNVLVRCAQSRAASATPSEKKYEEPEGPRHGGAHKLLATREH